MLSQHLILLKKNSRSTGRSSQRNPQAVKAKRPKHSQRNLSVVKAVPKTLNQRNRQAVKAFLLFPFLIYPSYGICIYMPVSLLRF